MISVDYPYSFIWVNGRKVSLKEIRNGTGPLTDHENNTFLFIREWLSDVKEFELKTSGSAGKQKKIIVTRDEMIASAELTREALGLKKNQNALICLDTRYIAGKMMVVRSFITGMRMFVVDPCANPLSKIPVDQTIHFTAMVPYQVAAILESNHPHLMDCLYICLIGGGPLNEAACAALRNFSSRIYLTYAMTETVSHIALYDLHAENKARSYRTLRGISVASDERGCLVIYAPYLKEPVVTNDIVEIINKYEFVWKGRADNIINSGGVKIAPEAVEEKIGQIFTRSHLSNEFFIYGIDDKRLGQKAVLILKSPVPDASTLSSLMQALHHSIPPYEMPKEIYEAADFVYTETRKVNRRETFKSARLVQPLTP